MSDVINVTTGLNGSGTFDQLMKSVNEHIQSQYDANRIKQADFAKVYLSSLQVTLQQAISYELQSKLNDANIELINSQTSYQNAQTAQVRTQERLIEKQIELSDVQITKEKLNNELLELNKQVTAKQVEQLEVNIALTEQNRINGEKQEQVLSRQVLELDKRIALLAQREVTERSQTQDDVDGVPVKGVIGAQRELYGAQKEGFTRDAEQKASKLYMDFYSMLISNDNTRMEDLPTAVNNGTFGSVVEQMVEGVGANITNVITTP